MRYLYNKEDSRLEVVLEEEIDVKSCKVIRNIIDGYIIRYEPKNFVMNFKDVKFMDSSGIGLLIGRYNLIKLMDSNMIIIGINDYMKRLIKLSELSDKITIRGE